MACLSNEILLNSYNISVTFEEWASNHKKLVSRGQTAIFLQGVIAFSISARKNIGSGVVPIAKLFLTPPSQPEVLKCLLSLPQCLKIA